VINWRRLTTEQTIYVLKNASHPLGALNGIPEARRLAEIELGDPELWNTNKVTR
jgi:hypothetical protein